MDKKDSTPQRLVRPTAARAKPAGSSTPGAARDVNKNGSTSSPSSSTSITGDIVKKLTLNAAISPINANRPGRLPSFRGERDLTLGSRSSIGSLATADGGAKPKKEFKPTIPARRTKNQDSPVVKEEKGTESNVGSRGRGRREGTRGRGRGKPELIQITGSIFGDGVSDIGLKNRSSSSYYGDREGSGSSGGLEKPRLNTQSTKVNKEEEDAALSALLRDDFIEENYDHDPDKILQPIQLPKSSLDPLVKQEEKAEVKTDIKPTIVLEGGITIKQEKEENKPTTDVKSTTYQRRLNPSQVTSEHIFQNQGDILFFQLPDSLPSLKADMSRPQVKLEPGIVQEKTNEQQPETEAKTVKESVFVDIPEGRLGTLKIHKSGKIYLHLGDHSFVIDSATQVSYLQDLLSVEVDPEGKKGKMRALGPIKYKAVCIPDWENLIDDS